MTPWKRTLLHIRLVFLRRREERAFTDAVKAEGLLGHGPMWAKQQALLQEMFALARRLGVAP